MVVCGGIAVFTILSGGAAAPIAAGLGGTVGTTAAFAGTDAMLATASAVGAMTGAYAGATTGGTLAGAGIGAVTGGTAAAGVGFAGAGAGSLANTYGSDGLGLLALGTSVNYEDDQITYDCWKPVVHDQSTEPSSGMLLRDMVNHPNVAKVTMTTGICTELPNIVIENIWQETFEIQYLLIHSTGKLACHAKPVDK